MRRTPPPAQASGRRVEDAEPVLQDLERVLEEARQTLDNQRAQEADFRDRLYELRQANNAADPFWLVIDISRSTAYSEAIRDARDQLLSRAKALNPQLTTWDKAIDPAWKVSEISTRTGKRAVRPFQPPLPLLKVLQGVVGPSQGGETSRPTERVEKTVSRGPQEDRSAIPVPVEPPSVEPITAASETQPPVGTNHRGSGREGEEEPKITRELLRDIQDTVDGMKRFLNKMEEKESRSSSSGETDRRQTPPGNNPD